MYRILLCLVAAVSLSVPVGCRSCAHPYDYCGPTFTDGGGGPCGSYGSCGPCDPNSRAGSILVSGGSTVEGTLVPEPAPESAPQITPEPLNQLKPISQSMRRPKRSY